MPHAEATGVPAWNFASAVMGTAISLKSKLRKNNSFPSRLQLGKWPQAGCQSSFGSASGIFLSGQEVLTAEASTGPTPAFAKSDG